MPPPLLSAAVIAVLTTAVVVRGQQQQLGYPCICVSLDRTYPEQTNLYPPEEIEDDSCKALTVLDSTWGVDWNYRHTVRSQCYGIPNNKSEDSDKDKYINAYLLDKPLFCSDTGMTVLTARHLQYKRTHCFFPVTSCEYQPKWSDYVNNCQIEFRNIQDNLILKKDLYLRTKCRAGDVMAADGRTTCNVEEESEEGSGDGEEEEREFVNYEEEEEEEEEEK